MIDGRQMSRFGVLALALFFPLAVAACGGGGATASRAPVKTSRGQAVTVGASNTSIGRILVDSQGRTLYLFKLDSGSRSECLGACASAWPPLTAHGNPTVGGGTDASLVATIHRPGGALQVTYNRHPLYLFAHDEKPGDVNGEGLTAFGAPWFAVSPAGNEVHDNPAIGSSGTSSGGGSGY
jgi:predicted lipoprotein with Yx(FWY)xxD motif